MVFLRWVYTHRRTLEKLILKEILVMSKKAPKTSGIVMPPDGPTVTVKADVYEALCSCYAELRSIYKQFGGNYSLSAGITDVDAASPDFNPTIELDSFNPRQYIGFIKKTVPQNTTTTGHQHKISIEVLEAIKCGLFAEDDYETDDLEAAKKGLFKYSHTYLDLFYMELENRFMVKFTEVFKEAALNEDFSYDQLCRILRAWMQSMPKYEPFVAAPKIYAALYAKSSTTIGHLSVLNEREIRDRIVDSLIDIEPDSVEPHINEDSIKDFLETTEDLTDFLVNLEQAFSIEFPVPLITMLKELHSILKFKDILNILLEIKNYGIYDDDEEPRRKKGKKPRRGKEAKPPAPTAHEFED
jgi:hypothetical protein